MGVYLSAADEQTIKCLFRAGCDGRSIARSMGRSATWVYMSLALLGLETDRQRAYREAKERRKMRENGEKK